MLDFFKRVNIFSVTAFLAVGLYGSSGFLNPIEEAWTKAQEKGLDLWRSGEFWSAIPAFQISLRLAKEQKNLQGQINSLRNLGILTWNVGQLKESAAFFSEALAIARRFQVNLLEEECSMALQIHALYSRAKEERNAGRHQQSTLDFEKALGLARTIRRPEFELKCLRQQSVNNFELGKLDEFLNSNEKALEIARKLRHRQEEGRCLNNVGLFYWKTNRYSKALAVLDEALRIHRETNRNRGDIGDCLNNIGMVYRDLGNYDKALQYLKEAMEIDEELGNMENIAIDLNNIGAIYRNKGELSHEANDVYSATSYYFRSLEVAEKVGIRKQQIDSLNNIALVYSSLGNYTSALANFSAAFEKAQETGHADESGNICCNIGHTYLRMGKYDTAKEFFQKAANLAVKMNQNEILWETYFGLGKCLEHQGELSSALTCYKKSVDIIDLIRRRLSSDDQKTGFVRDKYKVYESLLDLLYKMRGDDSISGLNLEMWRTIERARARAFLEELAGVQSSPFQPADTAGTRDQMMITRKISAIISRLAEPDLSREIRLNLLARLEQEEDEYASLMNQLRADKMRDLPSLPNESFSLDKIRHSILDSKTAAIEYFLGERQSFIILITQQDLILKRLPSRTEIEDSLRAYLKVLATPPKGEFPGLTAARRIYHDLLSPVEANLPASVEHLVIVPDGILYYLPFETLVREPDARRSGGKYLIERYRVSYAPSLTSLAFLMDRKLPNGEKIKILAMGNPVYGATSGGKGAQKASGQVLRELYLDSGFDFSPLPNSRKEVLQIAQNFPKQRVDIYLGLEAKEQVVKRASVEDYQIIHFACHGFLDERAPLRSALVLTPDDNLEEDGFLQAREVYQLRLKADLVVLSACQTGRGRLENGEGILGLPRIFFYAGAGSTISSLWKISDRSAYLLMRDFYRFLAGGNDEAQAMRQAKLKMLRSKFSHPFYWAGFVLNGDYRSRWKQ